MRSGVGDAPITSPNDPVFFLHHSNIDRIWALWEDRHTNSYAPVAGGPPGNNLNDAMVPWAGILPYDATIASVLDIRALGYRYDDQ